MSWWPFPIVRNHSTDPELTTIFCAFAAADDLQIAEESQHETIVETPRLGRLLFWSANRYFAWAGEGKYEGANGTTKTWRRQMPSRAAVRAMRAALSRARILRGVGDAQHQDPPPVADQPSAPPASMRSQEPTAPANPIGTWDIKFAPSAPSNDDLTLRDLHAGFAMAGILASVRDKAEIAAVRPEAFYAWADEAAKAREPGFALVPLTPDDAMLRPFHTCPPEELPQAYSAMLLVAQRRRTDAAAGASHR